MTSFRFSSGAFVLVFACLPLVAAGDCRTDARDAGLESAQERICQLLAQRDRLEQRVRNGGFGSGSLRTTLKVTNEALLAEQRLLAEHYEAQKRD